MAKALWDDENLYVAFICEDALIWTEHTKRDTSVGEDDTVAVFTVSNPEHPQAYLNIEMNFINPYQLLGINPNMPDLRQLRKSYYQLALLCHPDKGGNKESMDIVHKSYLYIVDL